MAGNRKVLSGGLKQAGVKGKKKRARIKEQIIAGKPGGLKRAGVVKAGRRRDIRENVRIAATTRAKRATRQRRAGRPERQIRSLLTQKASRGGRP